MMSWDEHTLGELCSLITDGKHGDCKNEDSSGYYFISCKDVKDGRIHYDNARQIIQTDFAETHRRTDLKPGDVLLTNSGTIGRLAIAPDDDKTPRTTFQKSVAILKPLKEKISSEFLYYTLATEQVRLINSAGGAAQKNLLLGELRRFPIKVPPLTIQNQITFILSAYDDLIENNRRRIQLLEQAARLLYKEWFVHLRFPGHERVKIKDGIPEGWEKRHLFDVASPTYGFAFKSNLFNTEGEGVPVARIRDIPSGESQTWTTEDAPEDKLLADGDFVIGMDGDFHMNFWVGGKTWINQRVVRIKGNSEISDAFLRYACERPIQELNATIVGTTVAHLGAKHMKLIKLLIPPKGILYDAQNLLDSIQSQIVTLSNESRFAKKARDLLLPRLMNGEVAV